MNTRQKIVSLDRAREIAQTQPVRWMTGYFDPMLAGHARKAAELTASGELLVAIVADPPDPLLPRQARAELAAALGWVDYVVMEDAPFAGPPFDADIATALIRRVVDRHNGKPTA